ncbi:hypothetical protein PAN31117_03357 [Pandoraea anapnoica]|uniref:DUF2892 domain-containing protein n=1 Tax=Pandoraea anapnoica TaxID=2508301 RepID=A0A5E5A9K1_9BURK|nr:hypothetical protein [Pandoraea anapnoica]VVE69522.1 hypothetical protein PAN31117_03357 [Pandoraea anapnoica]
MKIKFIENGNFSRWVREGLLVLGASIMVIAVKYVPPVPFGGWLFFLGFGLVALGGLASNAHMLDIKPFDNENKKARKTYSSSDEN